MGSRILFEHSYWFFVLCFLIGIAFAAILYWRFKGPWSDRTNLILAGFRAIMVSLLAGLLVGPYLRLTLNEFEPPITVFAIDNSSSLALVEDSTALTGYLGALKGVSENLESGGIETRLQSLQGSENTDFQTIQFGVEDTDLNGLLSSIQNDFEGTNLGSVVLLSDGIYTKGISPTFSNFSFPIYTIGVGDTVSKKDLVIRNVLHNRLSYQGNRIPVVVEVYNEGFVGESSRVSISRNNREIASATVDFTRNNMLQNVEFFLDADEVGLQRYSVRVDRKQDEFTFVNNSRQLYIDVIDGKERILICAPAPHPDIKAIVSAIESNENYEVRIYIPGIHETPSGDEPDLVIFHDTPNRRRILQQFMSQIHESDVPELYIVGGQTNLTSLNDITDPVKVNAIRNQGDFVTAAYNSGFNNFSLSQDLLEFLPRFPPVRSPFGKIEYDVASSVLLNQKVGSIETDRPLILFRNDDKKTGIIYGEGIWQWKLAEYSRRNNNDLFNEIVLKSIQFLTTRDDKRKFRLSPAKNEFFESEAVVLEAEAYNSLYEIIYDVKVDLSIVDESDQSSTYTFVTSERNSTFTLRDLNPGIYKYTATAQVNEDLLTYSGEFAVRAMDLEGINLTADHNLMRNLATKHGGDFYLAGDMEGLTDQLLASKPPDIIHSSESFFPLINLIWALVILLVLISGEWFIRKYEGGY